MEKDGKRCKEKDMFTVVVDENNEYVILKENPLVSFNHNSETLYTCECNFKDVHVTRKRNHKVLVRFCFLQQCTPQTDYEVTGYKVNPVIK